MLPYKTKTLPDVAREVLREYAIDRGLPGLPKLFAKGVLLVWHYPAHRRWLRIVGGPTTRRILEVEPRTAFRHSSKYLFAGLPWRHRIALMSAHYAFLNAVHDDAFFNVVIERTGYPLWRCVVQDDVVSIVLLGPPHHREGDLRLHLKLNGTTIFKTAFSVLPASFFDGGSDTSGSRVLYIGQVQGAAGELDAIRHATKLCHDIAPQDLIMSALAGLGQAWGIDRFLSAGPELHHSAEKLSRVPHAFDYAMFWERYGATLSPSGHYVIHVPFPQKPIAQIVVRHRKRAIVKRDFKQALSSDVQAVIAARLSSVRSVSSETS